MLNGPGEYVTIENHSKVDFHYRFQGSNYTIAKDAKKIVPWTHFAYILGDPYHVGWERELVLHQCMARYGCRRVEEWPFDLRAFDADGDRIIPILDDPAGVHALHRADTDNLDPVAIRETMAAMQRRLAEMERLLPHAEAAAAAVVDAPTPDADVPPTELAKAAARAKAMAKAEPTDDVVTAVTDGPVPEGEVGNNVIEQVAPRLTPPEDIPGDGPMTDEPTRVPTGAGNQ